MRALSFVVVACTILLANSPIRAAPPAPAGKSASIEPAEPIYAWLDTLGYPGVKTAPFVRIADGAWSQESGEPKQIDYRYGLLLDDDLDTFQAFRLDTLDVETFVKTPTAIMEFARVGFDERDLAAHMAERIQEYREAQRRGSGHLLGRRRDRLLSDRTEFVILAWIAARRGPGGPADRLFTFAAELIEDKGDFIPRERKPLLPEIADDIARAETWGAVMAFGEPSVPRSELLRRFERIVANFPESDGPTDVNPTVEVLKRMVREDQAHARRPDQRPLAERPKHEQIAEWIFRLRDQDELQISRSRRSGDTARDGKQVSPAQRLAEFGYDAVPQLIDVIDDERFTRVIYPRRHYLHAFDTVTVGYFAEMILEEIAGRRFDLPPPKKGEERFPADETAAKQKLVRVWHDDVLRQGVKQTLVAAVESADENALIQAERLVEGYPSDAARPILVFLRRTADRYRRDPLIELLADLSDPEIEPFLLAEIETPAWLGNYVTAARMLNHRNHPEGVTAMLRRWEQAAETPDPRLPRDFVDDFESQLGEFLVTSGRSAAVRAVAERMGRFNVVVRMTIVEACDKIPAARHGRPVARKPKQPDPDYDDAVIALLIRALDDDHERCTCAIRWNGKSTAYLRVCDLAGHLLRLRNSQKYPFDLADHLPTRDQARRTIIVAWHQEKGLPLPPERQPPTPVAPD